MALFAKQHYEAIAAAMQRSFPPEDNNSPAAMVTLKWQWGQMVEELGRLFENDNPQFKLGRFTRACHPGVNVKSPKGRRVKP